MTCQTRYLHFIEDAYPRPPRSRKSYRECSGFIKYREFHDYLSKYQFNPPPAPPKWIYTLMGYQNVSQYDLLRVASIRLVDQSWTPAREVTSVYVTASSRFRGQLSVVWIGWRGWEFHWSKAAGAWSWPLTSLVSSWRRTATNGNLENFWPNIKTFVKLNFNKLHVGPVL